MNNKVSAVQISILTFFLSRGFFIMGLVPLLLRSCGVDALLSILLGALIGSIIVFFYNRLNAALSSSDLITTIFDRFPKFFAYLFSFIIITGILILGGFILGNSSIYIQENYLVDPSTFTILLTFLGLCYLIAKGGLTALLRSAEIIAILFCLLLFLCIIGVIPIIEPTRIQPFFANDSITILKSTLMYLLMTTIPLFFLLYIPKNNMRQQTKKDKAVFLGYAFAAFTIFLLFVLIIGSLGIDLASYYQFPETAILKKVSYFHFIERIEGILSLTFLLDGLLFLSYLLYCLKQTLKHLKMPEKIFKIIFGICLLIIFFLGKWLYIPLEKLIFFLAIWIIIITSLTFLQLHLTKKKN